MNSYQKSATREASTHGYLRTLGIYQRGRQARLEPLEMWQSFNVDEFLELLNHNEPPRPRVQLLQTKASMIRDILRGWVDEWLDSGRADDGDDPRRRNFEAAVAAAEAAYRYSKNGRIRLLGLHDTLDPSITKYDQENYVILRPLAEAYAQEQLVFFLLSPVRFSLAQCRGNRCGTYFLLKQWNRLYPHGTLCEDCKRKRSHESAKVATARERKEVRNSLHLAAAKHFRKEITGDPLWNSNDALKRKIAAFLSAKFSDDESFCSAYPEGITGKWVANVKNWKPIEVAAKGGK